MNRIVRSIIVPSLAVLGVLVALPSVAHAEERGRPTQVSRDGERGRSERERFERERHERERLERERHERLERERVEHERLERARQQQRVCAQAYESGASAWRLREMGCYVR